MANKLARGDVRAGKVQRQLLERAASGDDRFPESSSASSADRHERRRGPQETAGSQPAARLADGHQVRGYCLSGLRARFDLFLPHQGGEVAGKLVGNKKLEEKGKVEKIRGEAQAEVGDVKQAVKDAKKGA